MKLSVAKNWNSENKLGVTQKPDSELHTKHKLKHSELSF